MGSGARGKGQNRRREKIDAIAPSRTAPSYLAFPFDLVHAIYTVHQGIGQRQRCNKKRDEMWGAGTNLEQKQVTATWQLQRRISPLSRNSARSLRGLLFLEPQLDPYLTLKPMLDQC